MVTEQANREPVTGPVLGSGLALQLGCLVGALALWFACLPLIDAEALNDFGLIAALPAGIWIAYALLVATFAVNMIDPHPHGLRAGLTLAGLVAMLHLTPALVYGNLRYSWAWKHVGIVDYIQRHGALDPMADFLAAYHNWPALFVSTAWLADAFGLGAIDLARLATYVPFLVNLAYLALLPSLFARLTADLRIIWPATALFIVGNWVGQDYFSPQGVAFLLYLAALALCLGPLAKRPRQPVAQKLAGGTVVRLQQWLNAALPLPPAVSRPARIMATVLLLTTTLVMVATHQLTPLLLISALAGLVALNRISAAFLAFAVTAEIAWLFYFAGPFTAAVLPDLLAEFGNTAGSALGKMADLGRVSPGQFWVSAAARGLTGFIAALALIGGFYRLLTHRRDGVATWLVLAPLPLIVATSYGGEILFRVYFYALPGLCFFAAAPFESRPAPAQTRLGSAVFAVLLLALVPTFILANNGKDQQYRFTPDEVEAASWLYANAPAGSLLIEGSRSYPSQFLNYENFVYVPISEEDPEVRQAVIEDAADVLGRWLSQSDQGGFIILTRSQRASVEDIGIMPPGSFAKIEASLLASDRLVLVRASPNALVFTLHPQARIFDP